MLIILGVGRADPDFRGAVRCGSKVVCRMMVESDHNTRGVTTKKAAPGLQIGPCPQVDDCSICRAVNK